MTNPREPADPPRPTVTANDHRTDVPCGVHCRTETHCRHHNRCLSECTPADLVADPPRPFTPEQVLARLKKAQQVVGELSEGKRRWVMSIPARPDDDPDLIITGALQGAIDSLRAAAPVRGGDQTRLMIDTTDPLQRVQPICSGQHTSAFDCPVHHPAKLLADDIASGDKEKP